MMCLNGFKGAKQEGCFSSVGVGMKNSVAGVWRVWVGCGSVRLGDGFGNEVIDQWGSEQIGGVCVAFAFC